MHQRRPRLPRADVLAFPHDEDLKYISKEMPIILRQRDSLLMLLATFPECKSTSPAEAMTDDQKATERAVIPRFYHKIVIIAIADLDAADLALLSRSWELSA
jgi:hypothetical protein